MTIIVGWSSRACRPKTSMDARESQQRDTYLKGTVDFLTRLTRRVENGTFFYTDNYHHLTDDVRDVIERTIDELILESET